VSVPWLDDGDVRLYHGDVAAVLAELPDASVDCVVTSPPYWGLRDYGVDGQIGLEASPEEYAARLVAVFREVRRVLAPQGVCWLNLGDSYAGSGPSGASYQSATTRRRAEGNGQDGAFRVSPTLAARGLTYAEKKPVPPPGLKPKDLVGVPWRVALALQADGWWLRSDVIWSKPNPMPESVTDRPTRSHEYLFLLTRSPRYWWDAEAVREDDKGTDHARSVLHRPEPSGGILPPHNGIRRAEGRNGAGRNVRSVWEIATQPFPAAHFATFPEALVERCLAAGCPAEVCRVCGEPRRRIVERTGAENDANEVIVHGGVPGLAPRTSHDRVRALDGKNYRHVTRGTDRWSDCGHGAYRPGRVLDCFVGSGTTALVARRMGRQAIGIDLSADYLTIAARRLQQLSLLGGAA
jgi:DNA modification methylase